MKITGSLILVLSLFAGQLFAQADKEVVKPTPTRAAIEDDLNGLAGGGFYYLNFVDRYEGVRGTPFLNTDWEQGGVYLISGKYYNNINLKLDAYNDELLYKNDKDGVLMLDKSMLDYFILFNKDGSLRKFKLVRTPQNPLGSYYEILYDKKSSFMIKHIKQFVKADYQKAINANRPYDEFKDEENYYVMPAGTEEPVKVRLNKSSAQSVFGNKSEISSYIRSHHLSMKNEQNWIDVMEFYDSIGK